MIVKIYIYQIWFLTSKKSYIGQTKNLQGRLQSHLHSGSLVCKALWKYDDWQISILHTVKTRDEANRIEIEEIRNYNSVIPNGYNLTRGGNTSEGYKHTEETKKKMSKSQKGRKHSEETKKKMRQAREKQIPPFQNKKHSVKTLKKMSNSRQGKQLLKLRGKNNPSCRLDVKIKKLKTRIINLEKEII